MRINLPLCLVLSVIVLLGGCTSVGERTQLSVGYYTVEGQTFSQLDRQISLHGPNVSGVGRALAATNILMVPDIRFSRSNGKCVVTHARISVRAKVTLPRHANIQRTEQKLRAAWNNLEEYARLHEAIHVSIADKYALKVEKAIKAIEPEKDCKSMRQKVLETSTKILAEHEREQLKFDREEQERIQMLVDNQNKS